MPNRFISDLTGTMRSFFKIGATLRLRNNNGTLEVRNGDDTTNAPLTAGKLTLGAVAIAPQKLNLDGHIYLDQLVPPGPPTVALAGLGAGNLSNGLYYYWVSFVNAEGETDLNQGASVTVSNNIFNGQVRLTNVPIGPASRGVTARRLYRSKVGGSGSYLLTTINDNTTTSHIDNTPDSSLIVNYWLRDNTTAGSIYCGASYNTRVFFSGRTNLFIGPMAGFSNTGGSENLFLGNRAGFLNGIGSSNVFLGNGSGNSNTSGIANTCVGNSAGGQNTSGSYNTCIGLQAGSQNITGTSNTSLGFLASVPYNMSYSNTTCLGAYSTVSGSNQLQLGDYNTTAYAYGAVQNRSDARWKEQIEDVPVGLDFILKLKPRQYKMKDFTVPAAKQLIDGEDREIAPAREYKFARKHYGLIGQEVKQAMDALGVDFGGYQDHSVNGGEDVLTLGYTEFIAPMIRAIQEQQAQIERLEKRLKELNSK